MAKSKQQQAKDKAQAAKASKPSQSGSNKAKGGGSVVSNAVQQVGSKLTKANVTALKKQGLTSNQIQKVASQVGSVGKGAQTAIQGFSGGGPKNNPNKNNSKNWPTTPYNSSIQNAVNTWGQNNKENDLVAGMVNDLFYNSANAALQTEADVNYVRQIAPEALNFQRVSQGIMSEADLERMAAEGAITSDLMHIQGGYQLQDTAIQGDAQKYGYDKQAQASMYGADANLAAAQAAAQAQLGSAQAAADADKFGYAQQAQASMYGADKSAQASMYGADRGAEASMYGADRGAEASMYGADRQVDVAGIEADAAKYGYDKQAQASMYGADRNLEGVRAQADAQRYGYDKQLEGTKYGADRNLEGTKYSTDSSERVAFGGYASAEKQIGLRGAEDRKTLKQGTDETLRLRADARGAIKRAGARFYG